MTVNEKEKFLEKYGWSRRLYKNKIYWYYDDYFYHRIVSLDIAFKTANMPDKEIETFLILNGWLQSGSTGWWIDPNDNCGTYDNTILPYLIEITVPV